jgi:hypothetical protein
MTLSDYMNAPDVLRRRAIAREHMLAGLASMRTRVVAEHRIVAAHAASTHGRRLDLVAADLHEIAADIERGIASAFAEAA